MTKISSFIIIKMEVENDRTHAYLIKTKEENNKGNQHLGQGKE